MSMVAQTRGGLFDWTPVGVGAVWISCRCGAGARVRVLESLLEALCEGCGKNLALEKVRGVLEAEGAARLSKELGALGLGVMFSEESSLEALIASGELQRDLRLTLDLDPEAGVHSYGAAPLATLALPEEVEHALAERRRKGGSLHEHVSASVLARLAASVRAIGLQACLLYTSPSPRDS